MNFQYIPIDNIPLINNKYNQEMLRIVKKKDNDSQKFITKKIWKLLKQDFSTIKLQDFPNPYCIKITDSFLSKKISFCVFINEIIINQLEFKLNIKQSAYEQFSDLHKDLINYLKIVLEKIFEFFLSE